MPRRLQICNELNFLCYGLPIRLTKTVFNADAGFKKRLGDLISNWHTDIGFNVLFDATIINK